MCHPQARDDHEAERESTELPDVIAEQEIDRDLVSRRGEIHEREHEQRARDRHDSVGERDDSIEPALRRHAPSMAVARIRPGNSYDGEPARVSTVPMCPVVDRVRSAILWA